ncbi:uncharacterized protein ASCRUDRAFT_69875 [Ascoidea rubescens DSM 1968]|uniref:Peptide N-acetyl-beta-D-glucosaminyl asparaginase amidase A N-terminal domain-containing protein n=1 Tax=Ascoidea rubescens DSM 1968 TaxID=1344418 RepID=A0A1D2VIL3_9ASCO|nr:hypothetical protein ASCRUDRAFT_69875 [Ascoidea rubescens DSM 1968]ODV61370.1 hypothetical protein ASCRUDRAFT_69875 [Ascoidea rubescens DSM 1968]
MPSQYSDMPRYYDEPKGDCKDSALDLESSAFKHPSKPGSRSFKLLFSFSLFLLSVYYLSEKFVQFQFFSSIDPIDSIVCFDSLDLPDYDFFSSLSSTFKKKKPLPPVSLPSLVYEIDFPITYPSTANITTDLLLNDSLTSDVLSIDSIYEPPNDFSSLNITNAFLTLNVSTNITNVDSPIQPPIIFDIYFDDYIIWRSSSPTSNSNQTFTNSTSSKNITDYLSLLSDSHKVSLKLINGVILNDINITLSYTLISNPLFFNSNPNINTKKNSPESINNYSFFSNVSTVNISDIFNYNYPPNKVIPLSNSGDSFQLPNDNYLISIPQLPTNTTKISIDLFATALDEEINYFKNLLQSPPSSSDSPPDECDPPYNENGPLRVINIYADNIFIQSVAPYPTLLTQNQISKYINNSVAFQPLASTYAFNSLSYNVDLSVILPLLWNAPVSLTIEIISPIKVSSPISKPPLPTPLPPPSNSADFFPSSDWLLSANLLSWESSKIKSSTGLLIFTNSSISSRGIIIPANGLTQITKSKITSDLFSLFNITLIDGLTHSISYNLNTSTAAVNVQNSRFLNQIKIYKSDNDNLVNITIQELLPSSISPSPIYSILKESQYSVKLDEIKSIPFNPFSKPSVKYESKALTTVKVNKSKPMKFSRKNEVSLKSSILTTDVKIKAKLPSNKKLSFSRSAEAVDGILVKDTGLVLGSPTLDI